MNLLLNSKGEAVRIGNVIFVPALLVGIITFIIGFFTKLGALVGLGIAAIIAMCAALYITKGSFNQGFHEGRRLIDAIGWTAILSQLLAALGYLFNLAGVGKIISSAVASVVPADNVFLVVVAYCIGMVIFTMIMGNAFAAFAMITSAIGVPMLVVAHGAKPSAIGAIAMLAGYCGTLMTPMAANFNIVPVAPLKCVINTVLLKLNFHHCIDYARVEHPIDVLFYLRPCSVDEQSLKYPYEVL